MLPGTNERERKKKGVIYMRWTHVWMRDGILPLNCKRLETRSTVKIRVSRVGWSPFLLASETLLLSPPRKHHPHRSQLWTKLNFLVLLDYAWHGAERPPSCKKGDAKCCCPSYGHPAAGGNLLCWWLSPRGHEHAWWMVACPVGPWRGVSGTLWHSNGLQRNNCKESSVFCCML